MLSLIPLLAIPVAWAQLTPTVVYNPPPASSGAVNTNGSEPNTQYSNLLGNALYFYEAQRTGQLPADNRVAWRNNSVPNDGSDWGIDLTRGYFDAGDYSIDAFNLAGALFEICWGATIYGAGYDLANQTAYLDSMLRWGLDWAMRAHPSPNTIFIQVGDTTSSETYWGGDQGIPEPRPAYPINETHPGTDLASAFSSMFSMCSLLYSPGVTLNTSSSVNPSSEIQNATYAAQLRTHAEDAYSFAMNATMELYPLSVPDAGSAYNSSTYGDDLTLAAISLAILTNSSAYYAEAVNHYSTYGLSAMGDVFNWDARTPAVFQSFVEASRARPNLAVGAGLATNATGWQTQMENYLDQIVEGRTNRPYFTPGRLIWYEGDSNAAGLNPALNAATLFNRYAPMASTEAKTDQYMTLAKSQLDYALGKNHLNAVYIVGSHENSIKNPHSALASGGNNVSTIDTVPAVEAYVIYGACVGGPDEKDEFWDLRGDYARSEVAIDYNAPVLTLVAHQILVGNTDPYYTALQPGTFTATSGSPCTDDYPCDDGGGGGLSTGAKIAIGVIVPVVVIGLVLGAWWWYRRKHGRMSSWR